MTNTLLGLLVYRLQDNLTGYHIGYDDMSKALSVALSGLNKEVPIGAWVEMPDGSTFMKTYQAKEEK